jgi:beta-glucosidase
MFLPTRMIAKIGSPGFLSGTWPMIGLLLAGVATAMAQDESSFPFQNPNLPIARRVDDLVSRLTLEEKVA